jgi:hypothetical protein
MEDQPNFVSHVFNFEKDSRNEMANIIQYTLIGIILISLLNRGIEEYMPEPEETKGTVPLLMEIAVQCIVLFIGILFIHRIITYIPTLSGIKYMDQNVITVILPALIVLLSTNSLGRKVNILLDRFTKNEPPVKIKHTQPLNSSTSNLLPTRSSTSNPITQEPDFNPMFSSPTAPAVNPPSMDPMPANFGGFGNNMF